MDNSIYSILFFTITPLLGGYLSSLSIQSGSWKEWYKNLKKPIWNPPSWLFAPVWSILYICMGYASYLVWKSTSPIRYVAFILYIAQLGLNLSWSPIFFGYKRPDIAFMVIIILWFMIITNLILFYKISPTAGWLLSPYLGWVSFATLLNGYIVKNNSF